MPGFDRTGPLGQGAQTGRKMGKCRIENETTDETLYGRGLGRVRGRGFGRRFRIEDEKDPPELINRLFRRRRGRN